jgi:hypothetical protein
MTVYSKYHTSPGLYVPDLYTCTDFLYSSAIVSTLNLLCALCIQSVLKMSVAHEMSIDPRDLRLSEKSEVGGHGRAAVALSFKDYDTCRFSTDMRIGHVILGGILCMIFSVVWNVDTVVWIHHRDRLEPRDDDAVAAPRTRTGIIRGNTTTAIDGRLPWNHPHASAAKSHQPERELPRLKAGRFPPYGTVEFTSRCHWTMTQNNSRSNSRSNNNSMHMLLNGTTGRPSSCTILARPKEIGSEGISEWISQIVAGHILAQQADCRFLFDYGPGIDIHHVLQLGPWAVPTGFKCKSVPGTAPTCLVAGSQYVHRPALDDLSKLLGKPIAPIPYYRHAYTISKDFVTQMGGFRDLQSTLHGFDIETGMACSLGRLFHLAANASTYQSDLFTVMLPKLRAQDALVLTIYIRSGMAEKLGRSTGSEANDTYSIRAAPILECAIHLEQQRLSANHTFARVVWMVVTDSQYLKAMITESYSTSHREILTTRSKGRHTKTAVRPSNDAIAEAIIDWYLIGESDLVVTDDFAPSFADTATMRTVRPYYKVNWVGQPKVCKKVEPVLKWT